jgi:hypothetical protein
MPVGLVKPVVSVITAATELYEEVEYFLAGRFGAPDYVSPQMSFNQTGYYAKEMGTGLVRCIYACPALMRPDELYTLKLLTVDLETRLRVEGKRRVNIDPGYLSLAKLVLATTKDNVHRICIGEGVYAEVTLYFKKGRFHPWPWTYPDYANDEYRAIFGGIRQIYRRQVREKGKVL